MSKISESSIIAIASKIKRYGASRIIKGIGDDCAVIRTPGAGAGLITNDVFIEGVHFLPDQPPESVGAKLLTVNLSDIAAMGGRPCEAVVALMLPDSTELDWVERFYAGMERVARQFTVNIVGGDVSRHPDRVTISLTLTGRIRRDEVLFRSGGKSGDFLYVSGFLGDSDAGLMLLRQEPAKELNSYLVDRYQAPTARVELGRLLARTRTASACIDLSDGIAVGARQLAEASQLSIELDGARLPLSETLQEFCQQHSIDALEWALKAGGDYELLFAVPPKSTRQVERFQLTHPELPAITKIGTLVEGIPGKVTVMRNGESVELDAGGWEHFEL